MSDVLDHLLTTVRGGLEEAAAVRLMEDGVSVTTHCMFPSNTLVRVAVRGGGMSVVASDEGAAFGEALAAGIPVRNYDRTLHSLVGEQGLIIRDSIIYTPPMPVGAAPLAVLLVANTSQDVARWLFDHTKLKRVRDFKRLLSEFLDKRFEDNVLHNSVVVGESTKHHTFPNIIRLPNERRLIVDPVMHEASSINARVIANLDVKSTGDPRLIQRIVYDDQEEWTAADLNLLQVGAPVVPFSRASEVIERLAA